jgi:hypothetical protein
MSNFSSPVNDRSNPATPMSQRQASNRRKSVSTALATENAQSIKVICRFRPVKQVEIDRYGQSESMGVTNFNIDEERGTVETQVDFDKKFFTFDRVSLSCHYSTHKHICVYLCILLVCCCYFHFSHHVICTYMTSSLK